MFKSEIYPEMNPFLARLENALKNLPNNPKPLCEGFCLCYLHYDFPVTYTTEEIGRILPEKKWKYMYFATKKVTQVRVFYKERSKDFENDELEQYPGAIKINSMIAGVSGHDSMVDEAISALWIIVKILFQKSSELNFWSEVYDFAKIVEKNHAPDNKWISIIAKMLVEE